MSFEQRLLQAVITLGDSTFTGTSGNQLTLSGLRMHARATNVGQALDSYLDLDIYGMTLSQMNQLSTLGMQVRKVPNNVVTLNASSGSGPQSVVFKGDILTAYADFGSAPDVVFRIHAQASLSARTNAAPASSFRGSADVATMMQQFATAAGFQFENNGVNVKLNNPYFPGSVGDQIKACGSAADINWIVSNGTLAIWPKDGVRKTPNMQTISPETGMIGYPAYTAQGIMVKALYNPAIQIGQTIKVVSSIVAPGGTWKAYGISVELESLVPNGKWQMDIATINPNAPTPVLK